MGKFADTPRDISRTIFYKIVKTRNEDYKMAITKTFTTILTLPLTDTYDNYLPVFETKGEEDDDPLYYHAAADYRVHVFEGSKDVVHVRLNIDKNTDYDHNYNLFIDIETSTGTEEYHVHLMKVLNTGLFTWATLYIIESSDNKYTDFVTDAYMSIYPGCPVEECFDFSSKGSK